jgi:ssDNA-binding Zn-finger/Zn-ribbon topoisomerase 1
MCGEYDEDNWLDGYVCNNYGELKTDFERAGLEALLAKEKAAYAAKKGDKRSANSYFRTLQRLIDLNEPGVSEALKMGGSAFMRSIRKRILLEHSDQVDLNRCHKCNRIPRTPRARQCPWCHYNWRDEAG